MENKKAREISSAYGVVYLAQAIIDIAETLNPHRIADQKKVSRMIKDLTVIRGHECRLADKMLGFKQPNP